jgi:hypothetical protein
MADAGETMLGAVGRTPFELTRDDATTLEDVVLLADPDS